MKGQAWWCGQRLCLGPISWALLTTADSVTAATESILAVTRPALRSSYGIISCKSPATWWAVDYIGPFLPGKGQQFILTGSDTCSEHESAFPAHRTSPVPLSRAYGMFHCVTWLYHATSLRKSTVEQKRHRHAEMGTTARLHCSYHVLHQSCQPGGAVLKRRASKTELSS